MDIKRVSEPYPVKAQNNRSMVYPVNKLYAKQYQYFSLDAILNVDKKLRFLVEKYIDIFIINLEKNVGKTYWLIQETNKLVAVSIKNKNDKVVENGLFVYLFRSDAIMTKRKAEINTSDMYDYYFRGTSIFSKGTMTGIDDDGKEIWENRNIVVGMSICFETMGNWSSNQYKGYTHAFFDEYRAKKNLSPKQRTVEFSSFITYVSNFQRAKDRIQFYLFGNNEPGADEICEGMEIDKSTDYMLDLELGVFYLNLSGAFKGLPAKNNAALRLAKYSSTVEEFMVSNTSIESTKGIEKLEYFEGADIWGYFMLNGIIYKIATKEDDWLVRSVDENLWVKDKDRYLTFGFLTRDIVFSPYIKPASNSFIKFLIEIYRHDKLKFWAIGDRDNFKALWEGIVSQTNYRQIGKKK